MITNAATPTSVLFFGGNGHRAWRLERARSALERRQAGIDLRDIPYPGFEGRPGAATREAFLAALANACSEAGAAATSVATGIGALLALSLRADNGLPGPLILQGPVLWGLEQRIFPSLMRWPRARELLRQLLMRSWFQACFVRRNFCNPLASAERRRFFDGYARCAAFEDLFAWFGPPWLRSLETRLRTRPGLLDGITVWVGGRDAVVGPAEVRATERALGVRWPVVTFPDWGHYPMIDVPEEWADAVCKAVAAP